MLRSFITHVIMVVIAAAAAWYLTTAFDVWYRDCEYRRAVKHERRIRERHNRYE